MALDDRSDAQVVIDQLDAIAEMIEEAMMAFREATNRFGKVLISIGTEMAAEEDDDAS